MRFCFPCLSILHLCYYKSIHFLELSLLLVLDFHCCMTKNDMYIKMVNKINLIRKLFIIEYKNDLRCDCLGVSNYNLNFWVSFLVTFVITDICKKIIYIWYNDDSYFILDNITLGNWLVILLSSVYIKTLTVKTVLVK